MLTTVKSYLKVGVALFVALTAAYICIHPDFDLQNGVLHKVFDIDGYATTATFARLDCLRDEKLALMPETFSAHFASSSDSLDLICVRLC